MIHIQQYIVLGIVLQANDALELGEQISRLKNVQYILPEKKVHPYFDQLITRSNQWNETIEKFFCRRILYLIETKLLIKIFKSYR